MHNLTQYAGFRQRLLAVLLDILLIIVFTELVLFLLYGPEHYQVLLNINLQSQSTLKSLRPAETIIKQILPVVFVITAWIKFKGTPGKLLMGCNIVDAKTGGSLSFMQAIIRYFAYILSILPLGLGFLWIIWDSRRQAFHDKLAGSIVIVEDEAEKTIGEHFGNLR